MVSQFVAFNSFLVLFGYQVRDTFSSYLLANNNSERISDSASPRLMSLLHAHTIYSDTRTVRNIFPLYLSVGKEKKRKCPLFCNGNQARLLAPLRLITSFSLSFFSPLAVHCSVTTVTTTVQPNPMMVVDETSAVAPGASSSSSSSSSSLSSSNGHNGYGRWSPTEEGYQSVAEEKNSAESSPNGAANRALV